MKPGGLEMSPKANRERAQAPRRVTVPDVKRERTAQFLRGPIFVLRHHGAPPAVCNSFYKQADLRLATLEDKEFVAVAKDILLLPLVQYLGSELPPPPPGGRLEFEGAFLRWSRPRIRSYRLKNTHLWFSFFQSKRSAAPMSSTEILGNLRKHRIAMQGSDPLLEGKRSMGSIFSQFLKEESLEIGNLVFETGTDFYRHPENHTFSASSNASLESSRRDGGQKGFLRETEGRDGYGLFESIYPSDLLRMVEIRDTKSRDGVSTAGEVREQRVILPEREGLQELNRDVGRVGKVLTAHVAVVLEPLKVRTISKGPAVHYDGAKPWQKRIHSTMKGLERYRAIGRPIRSDDIWDLRDGFKDLLARLRLPLDDRWKWMSIDYNSATDGISASASRAAMEGNTHAFALNGINPGYRTLLFEVLAPHMIEYPPVKVGASAMTDRLYLELEKEGATIEPVGRRRRGGKYPAYKVTLADVHQTNGQLMGSPLSFPVLCQINYAAIVTSWFIFLRELGYSEQYLDAIDLRVLLRPILMVNGDDLLSPGTDRLLEIHKEVGRLVGLEVNISKTFCHRDYANINSTCYSLPFDGTPRVIPYLNSGLFFGQHKVLDRVGGGTEKVDVDGVLKNPYTAVLPTLLDGALHYQQVDVLRQYISRWKTEINDEAKGRNLFLPESVGGLGVDAPLGWRVSINKRQREIAGYIRDSIPRWVRDSRPLLPGRILRDPPTELIDPLSANPDPVTQVAPRRGSQQSKGLFQGILEFAGGTEIEYDSLHRSMIEETSDWPGHRREKRRLARRIVQEQIDGWFLDPVGDWDLDLQGAESW